MRPPHPAPILTVHAPFDASGSPFILLDQSVEASAFVESKAFACSTEFYGSVGSEIIV
jgi:hypothetical protein